MCNAKPGKRCSTHAKRNLDQATQKFDQMAALYEEEAGKWRDSKNGDTGGKAWDAPMWLLESFSDARKAVQQARVEYYETAKGSKIARATLEELEAKPQTEDVRRESRRIQQTLRQAQIQSGLRDVVVGRLNQLKVNKLSPELEEETRQQYTQRLTRLMHGGEFTPSTTQTEILPRLRAEGHQLDYFESQQQKFVDEAVETLDSDISRGHVNSDMLNQWQMASINVWQIQRQKEMLKKQLEAYYQSQR